MKEASGVAESRRRVGILPEPLKRRAHVINKHIYMLMDAFQTARRALTMNGIYMNVALNNATND